MSNFNSDTDASQKYGLMERSGCAIFGLAAILFSIERYLLFNYLGDNAQSGNQFAHQVLHFLFGEPPNSILDVLLGFDLSRDDLFFILQPRNWVLLIFQASHFTLNLVLVSLPFWLTSSVQSIVQRGTVTSFGKKVALASIIILPVVLAAIILFSTKSTTIPTKTATPTSEDCSQSNPIVADWLRETTPADTLTLTALQAAVDLYSNPRDTGKQEALDWQQRTIQAYDFMKEYQPIPQCLVTYHNLVTETLLQLSLTFSELELTYVAIDARQDHEPHLSAAKQHLADALKASEASVGEWGRLKSQGLIPNEINNSTSTPTNLPSQTSSEDNSCTKKQVTSYLGDVEASMEKANKLAYDFSQTQNREQATKIVNQMDDLFASVSLWKTPDCAREVQISLLIVIGNFASMQHALLNNDIESFNRDYKTYEIALNQLNAEIKKLGESVK